MGLRNEADERNVLMTIVVPMTESMEVARSAAVMAANWLSERDIVSVNSRDNDWFLEDE